MGLGTQDSFAEAQDFRERYGTTFTMLWDPTFESWRELGIRGQPSGMLVTADGTLEAMWSGRIPEDAVLERIEQISGPDLPDASQ